MFVIYAAPLCIKFPAMRDPCRRAVYHSWEYLGVAGAAMVQYHKKSSTGNGARLGVMQNREHLCTKVHQEQK